MENTSGTLELAGRYRHLTVMCAMQIMMNIHVSQNAHSFQTAPSTLMSATGHERGELELCHIQQLARMYVQTN